MEKEMGNFESVLRGVSTLDAIMKGFRDFTLILTSMTLLGGLIHGGHSTLDLVDPSFNPQIQTSSLRCKSVDQIIPLPDGKVLVVGQFNTYDRRPAERLARLNADGTIDPTFNSNLPIDPYFNTTIRVQIQASGKILVLTIDFDAETYKVIRLNSDGTIDGTFQTYFVWGYYVDSFSFAVDAEDRIVLSGGFNDGSLIRLTPNGAVDPTFQLPSSFNPSLLGTQNNKLIVQSNNTIQRLNENGEIDSSFTPRNFSKYWIKAIVQSDGKILLLGTTELRRLNENGSDDTGFPVMTFPYSPNTNKLALSDDGKITLAIYTGNGDVSQIKRFLANGTPDSQFTPYTPGRFNGLAVQADGGVLIGDWGCSTPLQLINDFVRLLPNGTPDPAFVSGIGFQSFVPGIVFAINVQPDNKVLIGGDFDFVNDVPRLKIARLNSDSTLDSSFQINTNGEGNYFSRIGAFGNVRTQNDGKIVASGNFDYFVNGIKRSNLVRLNPNGSIDPTFVLGVPITVTFTNTNRIQTFVDGKVLVGTSRVDPGGAPVPVKLTATGEPDAAFNANLFPQQHDVFIHDVAVQPDGKIIVCGAHQTYIVGSPGIYVGFLTRLNADGSPDPTFQTLEQSDKAVTAFVLQPDGKIVLAESGFTSNVLRLNADGSPDPTFNAGTADGSVSAMLLLSTGRIFVGGGFSNFNGLPRGNLVQLNADGTVFAPAYSLNGPVLSLAVDSDNRVFVGGDFTVFNAGSSSAARSFVAALIDAPPKSAPYDFDGDGRSDISVFRPSDGVWYLNRSSQGFFASQFGISTDRTVPADYDGDGKTDIAVFRDGFWWIIQSSNGAVVVHQFGTAGDIPVPADYTGDGRAELAVYRNGTWWMLNTVDNGVSATQFGIPTDKPVVADYDGDGKTDIAVFRDGFWWIIKSSNGEVIVHQFGIAGDIPVPADFTGDGRSEVAVYRNGFWWTMDTLNNQVDVHQFGNSTDKPVVADYDGDGKMDRGIYRDGAWWILNSTSGMSVQQFGLAIDRPLPAAHLPQ